MTPLPGPRTPHTRTPSRQAIRPPCPSVPRPPTPLAVWALGIAALLFFSGGLALSPLGADIMGGGGGAPAASATHSERAEAAPVPASAPTSGNAASAFGSLLLPTPTCSTGLTGSCPHLTPTISVAPSVVCRQGSVCPTGAPANATVTLYVNATGNAQPLPAPDLQVVFVVETSLFDGGYDPSAGDPGSGPCYGPCAESNGVPFFTANAGRIAQTIAAQAPVSNVSFAMVDYFATLDAQDDGDGAEYHVDVPTFVPPSQFGSDVATTFQAHVLAGGWLYPDSDFSDNFLHASSITALYGALLGSGLAWSPGAEHVIVWVGSASPRDPNYQVDYSVAHGDYGGLSATCEPSYTFSQGVVSPACESWVAGSSSIAALAQAEHVMIDAIALPSGTTVLGTGDYSGTGQAAQNDISAILRAGCDLASATGGSWEGPAGFSCSAAATGSGQGNLTGVYIPSGQNSNPPRSWSSNPALGWALTNIHVPTRISNVSALGTNGDTFHFVPAQGFAVDPVNPAYQVVHCSRAATQPPLSGHCASTPGYTGLANGGVGWSWPDSTMYLNDSWAVSFHVVATPSFPANLTGQPVSVDACTNPGNPWNGCSGPVSGGFSQVNYTGVKGGQIAQSFPPGDLVVLASAPLSLTISASPTSGSAPLAVQFASTVAGGTTPYAYAWTFGDGGTSRAAAPSHVYNFSGNLTATLVVADSAGSTASGSVGVHVACGCASLSVSASAIPTRGYAPLGVAFAGVAVGGTAPYTYTWDFGDGSAQGSGPVPSHVYLRTGLFTATLIVHDSGGAVGTANLRIEVDCPPIPLVVNLTANPTRGLAPLPVAFVGAASGGTGPYSFAWDFGDGGSASAQDTSHVYTAPGAFLATLTATDAVGARASASALIVVLGATPLSLVATATPTFGPAPLAVQFSANASGGVPPVSFVWVFGDGSGHAGANASHVYALPGVYTAEVWANDSAGSSATAQVVITASTSLTLRLDANPDTIPLGHHSNIVVTASGGLHGYTVSWTQLPPGCSAGNVTHFLCTATATGNWSIVVVVSDGVGDLATANETLMVYANALGGGPSSSGAFGGLASAALGVLSAPPGLLSVAGLAMTGTTLWVRARLPKTVVPQETVPPRQESAPSAPRAGFSRYTQPVAPAPGATTPLASLRSGDPRVAILRGLASRPLSMDGLKQRVALDDETLACELAQLQTGKLVAKGILPKTGIAVYALTPAGMEELHQAEARLVSGPTAQREHSGRDWDPYQSWAAVVA